MLRSWFGATDALCSPGEASRRARTRYRIQIRVPIGSQLSARERRNYEKARHSHDSLALLVVLSFRTDVPGQQGQFNAKNASEAVAIMAEHTARLGLDLAERAY